MTVVLDQEVFRFIRRTRAQRIADNETSFTWSATINDLLREHPQYQARLVDN